jgi:hypothetical protein
MTMTRFILLFLILGISACSNSVEDQVAQLEGYWNIEKVVLSDGSEKEFPFSNHMDFFVIEGSNGMKHRVSPKYDGTMVDYGSPVPFKWDDQDGELVLTFNEGDESYQQTVVTSTSKELVLLHENGTKYYYQVYNNDEKQ